MAAKLFGVPPSLLQGSPFMPALRADAAMSGSNKVHIQSTLSRIGGLPKSVLKPTVTVSVSNPYPVVAPTETTPMASAWPATQEVYDEPPMDEPSSNFVTQEAEAAIQQSEMPDQAWAEHAEETREAVPDQAEIQNTVTKALAMNLVTLQLEPVNFDDNDPQPEAPEDEEEDSDAVTIQTFQVLSLKQLRVLCKHLGVPTTGNKSALIERSMSAQLTSPLPAEFTFLSGWYTKTL